MTSLWISLWAAPAAVGFALFFQVRRRTLLPIALLAVAAHLLRTLLEQAGWSLVGASFAAALLIGAAAYALGPLTGEASSVYAFAPVIPLIPGSLIFEGLESFSDLIGLSAGDPAATYTFTVAGQDLLAAAAVMLALVVGATAPGLLRISAWRKSDR